MVEEEINELREEKDSLLRENKVEWLDFVRNRKYSRPLVVTLAVMVCQQLSGIEAVF